MVVAAGRIASLGGLRGADALVEEGTGRLAPDPVDEPIDYMPGPTRRRTRRLSRMSYRSYLLDYAKVDVACRRHLPPAHGR